MDQNSGFILDGVYVQERVNKFRENFDKKMHHTLVYTPSSMKIGELRHRIFSFNKAKFSSIAALWFKILTKIKGKKHGSKFEFHTGWSIYGRAIYK